MRLHASVQAPNMARFLVCMLFCTYLNTESNKIGNKSIRNGAAMALFLKGHSSDKIMLLGMWKSSTWLKYIRLQVLEFANLFSADMVSFNNFFELFKTRKHRKQHPKTGISKSRTFYHETKRKMDKAGILFSTKK